MVYEGLPTLPFILFYGSGDLLIYVRDVDIVKFGVEYKRVYMIPIPQVMWKYNIDPESLDYNISEYGVLVREYPAHFFHWSSRTPEFPFIVVMLNFDGSEVIDQELAQADSKCKRLSNLVRTLSAENEDLRVRLKEALERVRVLEVTAVGGEV